MEKVSNQAIFLMVSVQYGTWGTTTDGTHKTVKDNKGSSLPSTTGSTMKGGITKSIIDAVDKQMKCAGKGLLAIITF